MDIVDRLFVAMFDSLNERCKKALEAVDKQYPFEPLKVNLFIDCLLCKYFIRFEGELIFGYGFVPIEEMYKYNVDI